MALDAKDGAVLWKTYTTPEAKPTHKSATGVQFYGPSGATIWSSPQSTLNATWCMRQRETDIPILRSRRLTPLWLSI